MNAPLETILHKTTSVTMVTSEFEATVRVEAKQPASDGVVALTLREVSDHPLPPWLPGSHIDLILEQAPTRQYSLCSDPTDHSAWRIGVLRDPNGHGSSLYVHDQLQVGDTLRVRGPRNNFHFVASARYIFIAGGIGITPLLPMMAAANAAGADWTLYYGGRTRASMAFLDELAEHGDCAVVLPQDEVGLLDLAGLLGNPKPGTLVYCCGPEPLLAAVESQCASWPQGSLHVERFNAKPLTEPVRNDGFEVFFNQTGISLTIPPQRSILEVAREAGVNVLSSCGEGTCGTCETLVLEGEPDHRDSLLSEDERAANDCMMICVSRARSSRLVLDL